MTAGPRLGKPEGRGAVRTGERGAAGKGAGREDGAAAPPGASEGQENEREDGAAGRPGGERGQRRERGPTAILIGPPGAGKSTVGALLAGLLGVACTDTDTVVEDEAGKPVGDIFIEDGEPAFRAMERAAVTRCVASHQGILCLGGGAVMDPGTRELLASQRVVYLRTGFAAAAHRVGLDTPRPLLAINPRARLKELLEQRLPVYEGLAWLTVATDGREPQAIAEEIAAALRGGPE